MTVSWEGIEWKCYEMIIVNLSGMEYNRRRIDFEKE